MNKIQFTLVILSMCFAMFAKAQSELKTEYTVYFASNIYELSESAQNKLQKSLKDYDEDQTIIRLQAFTDDVGSPKFNEKLANQRSLSVENYLRENGVASDKIEILASKQLTLDASKDKATQRRKNRRVVIQFFGVVEESIGKKLQSTVAAQELLLEQFFAQEKERAKQVFSFDASLGTVITGKEGTIIQIPPNSLVRPDGLPVEGTVSFKLQEAYSYGDMLLQKLGTSAQGKQLETGGMFYMEAVDASGVTLTIKEGAELKASLPSEEAKLEGMQTFEGQEDAAGNVDWVATNQPVQTNSIVFTRNNFAKNKHTFEDIEDAAQIVGTIPNLNLRLPRGIEKPRFRLKAPRTPNFRKNVAPDKNTLRAKYSQHRKESKYDYGKRLNKKYRLEYKKYRALNYANNRKRSKFRRDSLSYLRAKGSHETKLAKYNNYNKEIYAKLERLNEGAKVAEYRGSCDILHDGVKMSKDGVDQMKSTLNTIKMELAAHAKKGYEVGDLLSQAGEINFDHLQDANSKELTAFYAWASKNLTKGHTSKAINSFYRNRFKGSWTDWESTAKRISRFYDRVDPEVELRAYQIRTIRGLCTKVNDRYNFKPLVKKGDLVKKNYDESRELIREYITLKIAIDSLKSQYQIKKNELGLLSTEEVAQTYGNVMTITSMGWINCDRFLREGEPLMDVEILAEAKYNYGTAVFVVFKDIKSVMQADYIEGRGFVAKNLPRKRNASIIAIHPVPGESAAEVFIQEGTIAQLDKTKPVFEEKTLDEVRAMMDSDLEQ